MDLLTLLKTGAPGFIRTLTPILVGYLLTFLARYGFHISTVAVANAVGAALGFAFYVLIRYLETHQAAFGWLLGSAKQPAYAAGPAPAPGDGEAVAAVVAPEPDQP